MTWGLRDYGTASWDGGDPACDHRPPDEAGATKKPSSGQREHAGRFSGPACWKCGARRIDQQLGLEATPAEYIARMVAVFAEVRRVLRSDGTLWVNMGDSYAAGKTGRDDTSGADADRRAAQYGSGRGNGNGPREGKARPAPEGYKPKDLIGVPWRLALALQEAGWWLRSDIIWAKPNPMPESVTDRPTKAHEYVFLFAKGQWKSRVVQLPDGDGKHRHLGQDRGLSRTHPWAREFAVLLATAILDRAEGKDQLGLTALDSEVGKQGTNALDGNLVRGLPVEHRAAILCTRFLRSDGTPEEFFGELYRLGVTLADSHNLLVGGVAPEVPLPPGVYGYGKGAIGIEHPGEVRIFDFVHNQIIASAPTTCKYYYDADAIREAQTGNAHSRGTGVTPKSAEPGIGIKANGSFHAATSVMTEIEGGRNARSVWTIATQPMSGVVVHGTRRIESPDCPVHGRQESPASVPTDDGLSGASQSARSPRIDVHPVLGLEVDGLSIGEGLAWDLLSESAATPHSNGTSRTDGGSEPGESGVAGLPSRTAYTEPLPQSRIAANDSASSRTAAGSVSGGSSSDPSAQTELRSARTSTSGAPDNCSCQHIPDGGKKIDHFAGFPEELPRRCILAGTSERGVCPDCGAPWSRVVERTGYNGAGRADATVYTGLAYASPQSAPRGPARNFGEPTSTTTGWAPTCTHAWCPSCAIVVEWKHEQRRQTSTTTGTVRGESSADPGVAEGAVRHRPGVQGATPELQPLREEVPQDVHRLRGGLPVGEQDRHPVRSVLSREVDRPESEDDQGIRDDGEGLHRAVPTGAPDGDEERLRAGAPGGDGRGAGPNALTRRSGGSHQWDQERQPPREPAGVDEDEARWDIEPRAQKDGALSRMRGALPTEGTCRQCGGSVAPLTPVPATVLDIFAGSGTTLMVAVRHGRSAIGIELNPDYAAMARRRIVADAGAEPEQAAEFGLTAQLRMDFANGVRCV